jgi:SAM-dependent methyltransferase
VDKSQANTHPVSGSHPHDSLEFLRMTPRLERETGIDNMPGVLTEVTPNDVMYQTDPDHYFFWGRAAIRAIRWVLLGSEKLEIRTILDLPSGHGRVLRALKAAFPDAELTAGDLDRDGVDFCTSTFAARPLYAAQFPRDTLIDERFDLIWCGSLMTHLDESNCIELLEMLAGALEPTGVLIFTTHGPHYRSMIDTGKMKFAITSPEHLVSRYDKVGFGYEDYSHRQGYGISACSPTWASRRIAEIDSLELACYAARGWGGFQDVYGCQRAAE